VLLADAPKTSAADALLKLEALIGLPRKNGKSSLASVIALHGLVATGEGGPEVYAAAGSTDQARVVFQQAREYVEASPWLRTWLRPLRSAIRCQTNNGVFRVLSADGGIAHGLNPSLAVIDELHVHRDPELYYALTNGVIAREEPLVVSITTAGYDRSSICWQLYEQGRALHAQGIEAMREAGFLFYWRQAPPEAKPDDRAGWMEANPSSWVTEEVLEREYKRLPEAVFRRLHLNQWTEAEDSWIRPGDWDAGAPATTGRQPEIDWSKPIWVGVDIGLKRDATALVWVQWHDDELHIGQDIRVPKPGYELSASENRTRLMNVAEQAGALREIAYDPWSFRESAEMLADEGLPMVEFPQTAARMAPASEHLYELVKDRRVIHDGSPLLRQQVLAAVASETERGWRISKRKSKERIDAAVALAMACERASVAKVQPKFDLSDYRITSLGEDQREDE
jgi:phage terminase large subunit-like protein